MAHIKFLQEDDTTDAAVITIQAKMRQALYNKTSKDLTIKIKSPTSIHYQQR